MVTTTNNPELAPHIPPQGSKPVYRRLLRGYGPIAALALALLLMAALVPTMDSEEVDIEPATTTTTNPEVTG